MLKTHPQLRTQFCDRVTRDDLFKDAASAIMKALNQHDIPNDAMLVRLSQTLKAVVKGDKKLIEREKKALIRLYDNAAEEKGEAGPAPTLGKAFADKFISEANKWLKDNPDKKQALSDSLKRAGAGR